MENERIVKIEEIVCAEMDVSLEKLHTKDRYGDLPTARFICWHIIKSRRIFNTHQQIADYYGKKQHCTILHGLKSLKNRIEVEKDLEKKLNNIKNKIHMSDFNNTHQIKLTIREQNKNNEVSFDRYDAPVEIDCDGEINSLKPIPRVRENKIEPMDDYPIFFSTTLEELAEVGYSIEFIPIKK